MSEDHSDYLLASRDSVYIEDGVWMTKVFIDKTSAVVRAATGDEVRAFKDAQRAALAASLELATPGETTKKHKG